MRISRAIHIIEDRHAYLSQKMEGLGEEHAGRAGYMAAELRAYEVAIEAMTQQYLDAHRGRAARCAMRQHLPESSC